MKALDRLALFVPGVVATRSDNFSNTNGVGFSSNGLRGRNNDQEIDGQNNNDNSVGGPGLFLSDTEFVGQYVLITNQFGPEYGRNAGSVVNVITKSGTNAWHGSVFGQNRSSYTEALSNTQHNTNKPGSQTANNPQGLPFSGPPRFNEEFSGGTIGGALVKNKAFLFGGFDNDLFSGSNVFTTSALTPTPTGLAKLAGCSGGQPNCPVHPAEVWALWLRLRQPDSAAERGRHLCHTDDRYLWRSSGWRCDSCGYNAIARL